MDFKQAIIEKLGQDFAEMKFADAQIVKAENSFSMTCIYTRVLTEAEKKQVGAAVRSQLPREIQRVLLNFKRSFIDGEIVLNEIRAYTAKAFPVLLTKLDGNVDVTMDTKVLITVHMGENTYKICEKQGYFSGLLKHFETQYIGEFSIIPDILTASPNLEGIRKSFDVKSKQLAGKYMQSDAHVIKLTELEPLVGTATKDSASYISEMTGNREDVTICGTVSYFSIRTAKSGREYAQFTLTDFTGQMKCLFFPRDPNVNSLLSAKLTDGAQLAIRGSVKAGESGGVTLFGRTMALCKLPENLVIKKSGKPVKSQYDIVFPKPVNETKQTNLFDTAPESPPACLLNKRVVVFDLETTGLDPSCYSITEIGAVAIVDGVIKESFLTFVNPEMPISLEITKITGIEEWMVKDAPKIGEVIGDFHKFCENSVMVAHNLDFDIKFIERFAAENDYYFDNEKADTLALAREKLKGLRNYKLDTVAAHLGVNLEGHHRAVNDAMATAQIYIELMKK